MNRLIAIIICMLTLQACASYRRCVDKYGSGRDTVYVNYEKRIPVYIQVPADSIQATVDLDSLVHDQLFEIHDSLSHLRLQYWIDQYNQLLYLKALNPARVFQDTVYIRDTVPCPPPTITLAEPPTCWQKITGKYKDWAAWTLPAIILVLLLVRKFK